MALNEMLPKKDDAAPASSFLLCFRNRNIQPPKYNRYNWA